MITAKAATDRMIRDFKLNAVPPKKRRKILQKISDHFDKVIMITVLGSLSDEQFEGFRTALGSSDPNRSIGEIVAEVPGLSEKVEAKLELEYVLMKAALNLN